MSDFAAAFSSTRIRGFSGHDLLTTTGSSATSHRVSSFFMLPLEVTYRSHRPNAACRTMPGFPSYCAGSPSMITSSITCCHCSYTGHHVFLHTRPDSRPNQVRLRYVPSTYYRFLQTPPLASDAFASRILFPINRVGSLTSSDWVFHLRWENKKRSQNESSHAAPRVTNNENRWNFVKITDSNIDVNKFLFLKHKTESQRPT